jgi:hypothetical protein
MRLLTGYHNGRRVYRGISILEITYTSRYFFTHVFVYLAADVLYDCYECIFRCLVLYVDEGGFCLASRHSYSGAWKRADLG